MSFTHQAIAAIAVILCVFNGMAMSSQCECRYGVTSGCIEFISLMVTTSRVANAETRDEPVFDINVRGKIHSVKLPCNNFAHCGKGVTNIFDFDIAKFFPDCDVPCITAPDILQAALSHPHSADPWHISTAYTTYVTCGTAITSTVNAPFNRWVQGAGRQVLGVPKH